MLNIKVARRGLEAVTVSNAEAIANRCGGCPAACQGAGHRKRQDIPERCRSGSTFGSAWERFYKIRRGFAISIPSVSDCISRGQRIAGDSRFHLISYQRPPASHSQAVCDISCARTQRRRRVHVREYVMLSSWSSSMLCDFYIMLRRLAPIFSIPSTMRTLGAISMYHQDRIPAMALTK